MGEIKAGVVVVTEFCRPHTSKFQGYIDYINRTEAVRNENTAKYNLYQDYMGNPEKTTALFTAEKDELTKEDKYELKEIFDKAQENESIMWQTVISFDNRWLKQNGIINESDLLIDEAGLKNAARGGIRRMLENENLENAIWSAAIHFNTDNIHIHVATVEPVPMREKKEYVQYNYRYENGKRIKKPISDDNGKPVTKMEYKGRFKQSSIEKCKSYVVKELVNDKENNIKINNLIRESIVNQKKEHPLSTDKEFVEAFEKLHGMMPDVSRNLWNYNNPIMAGLKNKINVISTMYIERYHEQEYRELLERIETQEQVYMTAYGGTGKDYKKNKLKDLYTRMGNQILKEIRSYDKEINESGIGDNFEVESIIKENEETVEDDIEQVEENVINDTVREKENVIEDFIEPEADVEDMYYKWTDEYKEARQLIHQEKPDYEKAIKLLTNEHKKGNILATYELGEIYRYGRGRKINAETTKRFYEIALKGFEYQHELAAAQNNIKTINYLRYRIGKMYYYGLGTEQDYGRAFKLFSSSDSEYAEYMKGKMMYYGQGTEKDWNAAFETFVGIPDNPYASYKAASMLEQGELEDRLLKEYNADDFYKSAFTGFMEMEGQQEDDNLEYRIGVMYLDGKGVNEDTEKGIAYLEKSAEAGNVYAMNRLAREYINDGNEEKITKAIEYLTQAATGGNDKMAMYSLGNIYASDKYGMKNIETAKEWFIKAENNGNELASYKLGKLYYKENDIDNALKHLLKADSKYAWYTLGKIYLNEEKYYNPQKGFEYMVKAADEGNVFAQYRVGKEYYSGEITERNTDKAIYYLNKASLQNNEFASYVLGKIYKDNNQYAKAEAEFQKCSNEYIKQYAEYHLGKMYLDKEGEIYNPEKGIEHLEKSYEGGNSTAAFSLGITYLKGESVNQNKTLGMVWIEKAAKDGNEYAQEFLNNNINNFKGVAKRFNAGITHAMILNNAAQFLKKALKDEWQRRQNLKEFEMLRQHGEEME